MKPCGSRSGSETLILSVILPGTIPNTGFRLFELEEASSTLCEHSCRVGIEFDRVSEHFDGFSPLSLNIFV